MPSSPVRFSQLRWLHSTACILSMIGAFTVLLLGAIGYGELPRLWMMVVGGAWLFLSVALMTFMPLLIKMESTMARQLGEIRDFGSALEKQTAALQAIEQNTRISDAAKSLAHREQEIEAVRCAIREDIRQENWDAALKLIDEMEVRFGYRQEAEAIREELDDGRNLAIQDRLQDAIQVLELHFREHAWDRAQSEIDRLMHVLPDDAKVLGLMERMKSLKAKHKQELLQAWDEAIRRSDVDHAIDVLKEVDQYLSPAEVNVLHASARDVFKEKLLQLGVQFRFAVKERRWQDALDIGLELVRDFPNARMANEVRDALDTLRERARGTDGPTVETPPSAL